MEYQDYEYQGLEQFEKKIEQGQEELDSAQKKLSDAGILGFEEVYEADNFGNHFSLSLKQGQEEWEVQEEMELVEKGVELAVK